MKKFLIPLVMAALLSQCTAVSSSPTTSLETSSDSSSLSVSSSTGAPNGLEPLVAVDDCEVPTLSNGWTCIWADEFEGTALDETKWNYEVNGDGGGNQELQYYRKENVTLEDGTLIITAKSESYGGKLYTSGRINTKYKGNFKYGRIQIRAKMAPGRGTWPALWMMPLMSVYGGWPNSGEIDIMEYVGYDPNRAYSTIHTEIYNHKLGTQLGYSKTIANLATEFHDYEMVWYPGTIITYIDNIKIGEFNYTPAMSQGYAYYEAFPFDQKFFLIFNLAVGGTWGGAQGVDPTIFPTTLEVEYARVYQRDYATLDVTAPEAPTNLQLSTAKNSLFWNRPVDDYGVEEYLIFLDGNYHKFAPLNQTTLTGLQVGQTYQVQIQAVDFVGRASPLSQSLSITFE